MSKMKETDIIPQVPCKGCLVVAICKWQISVRCDILGKWLFKYRNAVTNSVCWADINKHLPVLQFVSRSLEDDE
jgi:hypothetical protein